MFLKIYSFNTPGNNPCLFSSTYQDSCPKYLKCSNLAINVFAKKNIICKVKRP